MRTINRLKKYFLVNSSGSMPVMFALALIPMLACAGAAIDYIRAQHASTELKAAADNAVLAGTAMLAETNGDKEKAIKTAKTNFAQQMSGMTQLASNEVSFSLNENKNGISAKGTASIDTTLLKVIGIMKLPLLDPSGAEFANAEAPVAGGGSDIEISLMLDVTGSMCKDNTGPCSNDPKVAALKTAASGLIDTVVWADQSKHTSKVAVVPFNTHIRVGPDGGGAVAMKALTNLPATWSGWYNECVKDNGGAGSDGSNGNWQCLQWQAAQANIFKIMPCVTDRFYWKADEYDYTDDAPGSNKWMNATDGSRSNLYADSTDVAKTVGTGTSASDLIDGWNYDGTGTCWQQPSTNTFMPLTNNKSTLKTMVNGLQAVGSTAGPLGTSFTWFTLSPNWNGALGNNAQSYAKLTQTNANGSKALRKIAIIMTDGAYNASHGWVGESTAPYMAAAVKMCSTMKSQGIEIFTVGYELDGLSASDKEAATTTLQSCGTDIAHFYESFDAAKLQSDFQAIASNIAGTGDGIRLTK